MSLDLKPATDLAAEADRAILASYHPSGVVIDSRFEILEFRGDTSWCLTLPQGAPRTNLLKVCRRGLLAEIRLGTREAAATAQVVRREAWIHPAATSAVPVVVEVLPFSHGGRPYFVVLFAPRIFRLHQARGPVDEVLKRTERELAETQDYLNAIIEKERVTNEELKAANDEILTANEELISTNEEIAAAREETQVANDELLFLNEELGLRNRDLARASTDLGNLLESVQIPIVVLSEKLAIKHFTPAAEKVLKLRAIDLGHALAEITDRPLVNDLAAWSAEVLDTLETKDVEVQDQAGQWFSVRVKPCRSDGGKIDGVVVALVDIDSLKSSLTRIERAFDYAEAIVQTAPVPLLVLDSTLCVLTANHAFYRQFKLGPAESIGARIYDLGAGVWNIPRLKDLLEVQLSHDELIENYAIDHDFPHLGPRFMRLNARRLQSLGDGEGRVVLAIHDLTAERQVENEITAAKEAAEIANQAKSDFLANMSHEIRTPLGAILGYTELLSNPQQSSASAVHCVTRIRGNIEQLSELVDEILDIAKIEAGKFDVELVEFALLPELAETFVLLQDRAESKGLAFRVQVVDAIPEKVVSCPRRLRQILLNIAGNALKFTEKGEVSVVVSLDRTSPQATRLVFRITDTGCGVSQESIARLFEPFSQADSSVTRRFGGTGLGLTLARNLARTLGGDVELTASAVGTGTTFTCAIGLGDLTGVNMLHGITQATLQGRRSEITDWFSSNHRLDGISVLLVEDGPDNRELMTHFLTSSGANVSHATNGLEAIQMALSGSFSLVLMDIQMPILDGYEATRRLREAHYDIPIVALTAHAMDGEKERCLAAGCMDYISKPVKPQHLVATVARLAAAKPSSEALYSRFANDPAVRDIQPYFLSVLPKRLAALRDAEMRSDWTEVASLAHQMAGAAGGFGFPELGATAARIEREAQERPSHTALAPAFVAFEALCQKAIRSSSPHH